MNFGKAIKALRIEKGMSQLELSAKSGIHQATISYMERNGAMPTNRSLRLLAKGLDAPVALITFMAIEEKDVEGRKRGAFAMIAPELNKLILKISSTTKHEQAKRN